MAKNKTNSILGFNNQEERDQLSDEMISLDFLEKIRQEIDNRKISKKELANRLGTSPSYVTQLFQGDKLINVRLLTKIKRALGGRIEILYYPNTPPTSLPTSKEVLQLAQGTTFVASAAFPNVVHAITSVVASNQEVFHTSLTTVSQENSYYSYE